MKFIFDENLSGKLALGIAKFGQNVEHVLDYFPQGTTDIKILKFVGRENYFLVTKDKSIRYNKAEKEALIKHKVGAFFLVGKNMTSWQIVKQLINCWENILEVAEEANKPFIYTIRKSGKPKRIL